MNTKPKMAASAKPIQVAFLGTGFIAEFHARALTRIPGVHLTGVCDTDQARAQAFASRWRVPAYYTSLEEMLQKNAADVVHILLPPPMHAGAATVCLQAGRDVFIEKPLAISAAECRDVMAAAERSACTACVNHNAVFHPAFLRAVERIRNRELGAVEHVTACVSVPLRQLTQGQHSHWMFQAPGNIVLEQASHPLSQIEFLIGAAQGTSVLASSPTALSNGKPFYPTWQIALECTRGTAQCYLSFGTDHLEQWLHIIGQDGSLFVDLRRNLLWRTGKTRFIEPVDDFVNSLRNAGGILGRGIRNLADYSLSFLGLRSAGSPFPMSFQNSLQAFYASLRGGELYPGSAERGLAVVEACEALAGALETGATAAPRLLAVERW